jgi:hypothetical protein
MDILQDARAGAQIVSTWISTHPILSYNYAGLQVMKELLSYEHTAVLH